jgi:hypothetical protein
MKKQLIAVAAFSLLAGSAMAQSAFEGAYGELSTGYEKNTISGSVPYINGSGTYNSGSGTANATTNSAPLIVGLGYTFLADPKFTVGLGVDYSTLSSTTNNITSTVYGTNYTYAYKVSNRYNFVVTPGYVISKDQLVYAKAGYSMESIQGKPSNGGNSTNTASVGGYIVGLGYKQMIADGFYGFAEGNYMSYSKPNLSSSFTSGGLGYTYNPNAGTPSAYNFLVGLGYKF